MKNILNARLGLAAVAILGCLAAPVAANAQRRSDWDQDRWNQDRWGQDRYNQDRWNQGRRQDWERRNQWRPVNIRSLADRAERESNALRFNFERDYDRYDLDRYNRADNAKSRIQKMDENMEDFRRAVDNRHPWSGRDELQRAIRYAQDVQYIFDRNSRIHATVRGHWERFRSDLNELAAVYGISGLGGSYRNYNNRGRW